MTTVTISLPDSLEAFVDGQLAAKGYGNVSEYFCSLLREAQAKEQDARAEALLLDGLTSKSLPLDGDFWKHLRGADQQAFGQEAVKLFFQSVAENDILDQFEHAKFERAKKALFDIARRFGAAVNEAVKALTATPAAGAPRHIDNPRLTRLRTWPVNGFDEFKVYCLASLHGRRDIEAVLESQDVEQPDLH
jgi:antitoxin ParD1/3/4